MYALAFDPGVSTGIVLAVCQGATIVSWGALTLPDTALGDWLTEEGTKTIRRWASDCKKIAVLIERPPQRAKEPGGAARLIAQWAGDLGCVLTVHWYSPGEWKPWVKANPVPKSSTKPRTPHERDARSLVWYWLQTKERTP